ncbi:DNA-binding NarL/FixJ family response regulator [Ancylobacter sp. 3268]|uniref:hypothetical protein n=1 Tax=Ancylobacter sp. 3268 TaxID=2817752 RepID=UPI002865219B|nr:hypothetical protein [Ancylobacter sp. 3268]MDR6952657.1 DNA-binding NarL/FixJ family response regulator [Ancylobacter sp. 3268]
MSKSRFTLSPEHMPKTLREVVEYCGMDVAEALVREYAGGRIWVPGTWHAKHHLASVLGEDMSRRLVSAFGNSSMDVPRSLLTAAGRQSVIRQLHAEGWAQRDIARQLRCTQRAVSELLSRSPMVQKAGGRRRPSDPRQIDIEDLLR